MSSLTSGAIPLPVPLEVFYSIGQQYLSSHAHAYSLSLPPLDELLRKTINATGSANFYPGYRDQQERAREREREKEEEARAREKAEEEAVKELVDELYRQQEENTSLEQGVREKEEQLAELMEQLKAERETKEYLALQAREVEEKAEKICNELTQELSAKAEIAEALTDQNDTLKHQASALRTVLNNHQQEVDAVEKKFQMLETKVTTFTEQSRAIAKRDQDYRRNTRDYIRVNACKHHSRSRS